MFRRIGLLTALGSLAAFVVPSGALGATTLGATFVPGLCTPDTTYIQTVAPGNAYTAPSAGVITSWSYQAGASAVPTSAKLKIGRIAPGTDLTSDATVAIVGESTAQTPTANVLNTYQTRVPVQAGDVIGEYLTGTGLVGCSHQDDTYTDHYFEGDLSPGSSDSFTVENFQQDLSAVLEPDADRDGFGDETQDQCPTNAATQGACPVTHKKKKCKKHKKHRSAESAKKKKCKQKKHH